MKTLATIGLLTLATLPVAAPAQTEANRDLIGNIGTVSTHAEARTRLPNTVADVTVGIEATGKDVATVSTALGTRSHDLMRYLGTLGAERLTTGDVSVDPQNHTAKSGEQSIVGYTGSTSVSFRVPAERLGEVVTGALSHGANQVTRSSLTPREKEMDDARRRLAIEATKTAVEDASAVAEAAGEHMRSVKEVRVGYSGTPVVPMMRAYSMAANMQEQKVETAAGDSQISVNVDVTISIAK